MYHVHVSTKMVLASYTHVMHCIYKEGLIHTLYIERAHSSVAGYVGENSESRDKL